MHIPDGVLAGHVSLMGYGVSFVLAAMSVGKKKLAKEMSKISLITAVLFVASIITIPIGYTTVHFSFLGLAGVILGPRAFIATAIAVFLQLMLFKHGGVSTLGINIFNLGMGALVGWLIFSLHRYALKDESSQEKSANRKVIAIFAGLAGAMAGVTKVGFGSAVLYYSGYPLEVAATLFAVHIPVFILEALATGFLAAALAATKLNILYQPGGLKKVVEIEGGANRKIVVNESAAKLQQ